MTSVLLFDDHCGFCSRIVQWIFRHEHLHTLTFAPLDSDVSRQLLRDHTAWLQKDSVLWVDVDTTGRVQRILSRSSAVLRLCRYVGGLWHLLRLAGILPRPLRDALYDVVARRRHRLFANQPCLLPTTEQRLRFLDAVPQETAHDTPAP